MKWGLIGFLLGAAIPGALSVSAWRGLEAYYASFPPGEFVCGTPAIVPMALTFVVTPFAGLIGATVGSAIGSFNSDCSRESQDFEQGVREL
jgi:hypothetical protein